MHNRLFRRRSKKKIQAARHWPLRGKLTGDRWIPLTKGQWREKSFHLMTSSWHDVNRLHDPWDILQMKHYDDVIMIMLASQITSLTVVYSIVCSGVNQRKHQSSASLAFVWEIHRGPVNSPHKWPVTRKMFPFDDVIMRSRDIVDQSELRIEWQYCNGSQILFRCKLEEIMNCLSDNVLFELYCVGLQLMSVDANGRMITCLNIAPSHWIDAGC